MGSIIKISTLSDIMPFKTSWRVQVKVLHTWKSFISPSRASLEMVLSDEHGVKIHASCKHPYYESVERHCRVGEWILIHNFSLSRASGFERVTNHVFKISFLCETSVTQAALQCDNMFLNLHDFDNILRGSLNTCFLIDVIGEVLYLGGLDVVRSQRNEMKTIEFTLRDIKDQRLKCCLWGQCAELMITEAKIPKNGDVCLIRFARIFIHKGELQVCNSIDSSLVLINPEIAETHALKQKFHGENNSIVLYQPKQGSLLIQKKCNKWSQFPFRTIQQVKRTDKGGRCRLICTVYAIDTNCLWYYFACVVCKQEVKKMPMSFNDIDVPDWWCEYCNLIVNRVSPRFKLHLFVQDLTGESSLMLLDSAAQTIVKASAAKVLNGFYDKIPDQELPAEIVEIVGKTYGFGIYVDGNNIVCGAEISEAVKVWSLDDILWKKTKSLHQSSISAKKQCGNVIDNEKMSNDFNFK